MSDAKKQSLSLVFVTIWFGQLVSLIGSGIASFSLGIWVFQRTGSTTQFALISFFGLLPFVLTAPLAGVVIDRWDRRKALLLSDTCAGICTLAIALLLFSGRLAVWHIYISVMIASVAATFRWPTISALTTVLVDKKHYGRASGMVQMAQAAGQILSPAVAVFLITKIKLEGLLLVDFATFLFALVTLLAVRVPKVETGDSAEEKKSLLDDVGFGWRYIKARSGLLWLLALLFVANFNMGMIIVLSTPLILSFATTQELGVANSIAGLGMLAGGLVMSIWGGPQRRIYGIIGVMVVQGFLLLFLGFKPSLWLVGAGAFCFLFTMPILAGSSQAIWLSKVPANLQGRVFSVRFAMAMSSTPIAYLIAGPLSDRVFEPLMAPGGALAASVGAIIGVGRGRGIALLLMLLGLALVVIAGSSFASKKLLQLESDAEEIAVNNEPEKLTTTA